MSHLDTIVDHISRRYIIEGDDGTGKNTLVQRLMDAAMMRGFDVQVLDRPRSVSCFAYYIEKNLIP